MRRLPHWVPRAPLSVAPRTRAPTSPQVPRAPLSTTPKWPHAGRSCWTSQGGPHSSFMRVRYERNCMIPTTDTVNCTGNCAVPVHPSVCLNRYSPGTVYRTGTTSYRVSCPWLRFMPVTGCLFTGTGTGLPVSSLYHKVEDSSVGSTPRTAQYDSTHPRWQLGTRDDTR